MMFTAVVAKGLDAVLAVDDDDAPTPVCIDHTHYNVQTPSMMLRRTMQICCLNRLLNDVSTSSFTGVVAVEMSLTMMMLGLTILKFWYTQIISRL